MERNKDRVSNANKRVNEYACVPRDFRHLNYVSVDCAISFGGKRKTKWRHRRVARFRDFESA